MKQFEEYLQEGIVKHISINKERAWSLLIESERKMCSLKERLEKLGIKKENANDYVEYCYDIIMHLIRAKLYLDGFSSSGQGAHEAEVSYLRKLGFIEKEVQFVDQIRYFRNGILYYGNNLDKEYAEKVVNFTKRVFPQLKQIIKNTKF
ncbi:MAG TPA: hypothetical protein DEP85_03260 [Holosporales bacterium]|nr:hypothetical protein [Candidatus Woesearchaeota archaeon]HCC24517.1 hypothetical protein [Holosporales bacterium]